MKKWKEKNQKIHSIKYFSDKFWTHFLGGKKISPLSDANFFSLLLRLEVNENSLWLRWSLFFKSILFNALIPLSTNIAEASNEKKKHTHTHTQIFQCIITRLLRGGRPDLIFFLHFFLILIIFNHIFPLFQFFSL